MKAVLFYQYGGPEALVLEEPPKVHAEAGQVVIKVMACGVNHLDIWVRQGHPAYPVRFPHILGSDVAGIVVQVGANVSPDWLGVSVLAAPGLSCFHCRFCLAGKDNLCEQYRILGASTDGGYAEFSVVPATQLIRIPEDIPFEIAAAYPLTFLTAWHMLMTRARLGPDQTLLVLAGGSGIGIAAIEIGRFSGAHVITTASTEAKRDRALLAGAERVILYDDQSDFSKEVMAWTEGYGADVVLEHVGAASFDRSLRSLAKGGTLVTCGATTGAEVGINLRFLFSREISILGAMMGTRSELLEVTRLIGEKRLCPIIDSVHPLSSAEAVHRKMANRDHFGKFILVP